MTPRRGYRRDLLAARSLGWNRKGLRARVCAQSRIAEYIRSAESAASTMTAPSTPCAEARTVRYVGWAWSVLVVCAGALSAGLARTLRKMSRPKVRSSRSLTASCSTARIASPDMPRSRSRVS